MSESEEVSKAEATLKPRSRWSFLLRPWFLVTLTILAILVAIPLGYRSSRFAGIPPIDEVEVGRTEEHSDDVPAFAYSRESQRCRSGASLDPAYSEAEPS
ncbi:MAG: hypothetical protein O2820_09485 [Planctomycetota bacterium]|nr:hypothetical protein [Planctomycetota bacterium]MDA1249445.1 hypothetical protein [Planctomycetota bacterium]